MYLIQESSYHSDRPIYQKVNDDTTPLMFIPEARVAKDYFNTGYYEKSIVNWAIHNIVKEDMNVIDIGAHIGWYSIHLAKKAKHVYSFECSPKSFNYLCANIALNKLDYNITKYNIALSNKKTTTKYYIRDPLDGGGNGICKLQKDDTNNTPHIDVYTDTLDSFNLNNIGFIKIDVEGHELEVLMGATETLKRNNYPQILFESWSPENSDNILEKTKLRTDLFNYIKSIGYRILPIVEWPEMFLAVYEK